MKGRMPRHKPRHTTSRRRATRSKYNGDGTPKRATAPNLKLAK